jgi:hypothetical protein
MQAIFVQPTVFEDIGGDDDMAGPCIQVLGSVLQGYASPYLHAAWVAHQGQVCSLPVTMQDLSVR